MLPSRRGSTLDRLRSERSCVLAKRGLVAASVPIATDAGIEVLQRGGNAVDAAVAPTGILAATVPGGRLLVGASDRRKDGCAFGLW